MNSLFAVHLKPKLNVRKVKPVIIDEQSCKSFENLGSPVHLKPKLNVSKVKLVIIDE